MYSKSAPTFWAVLIAFAVSLTAVPVSGGGNICQPDGVQCDGICNNGIDEAGTPDCDGTCDALDDAASPDCNDTCDQFEESTADDCDGICDSVDSGSSPDCDGNCDAGEPEDSADCNDACNTNDAADSVDCDGICISFRGAVDDPDSPDCNGICDVGEDMSADDCDGDCDPGDAFGSPDCDGVCSVTDSANTMVRGTNVVDCNMLCEVGEPANTVDCDGICSSELEAGSVDCDGTCQFGESNSNDCNELCDEGDSIDSTDCNGICDVSDNANSPDCNGICDTNETSDSPDCDELCSLNEGILPRRGVSPDCNTTCEANEPIGTVDCDGVCDPADMMDSVDCDGICDPGEISVSISIDIDGTRISPIGSPDCNGICDVNEVEASGDCNGVCREGEQGSVDCNGVCESNDQFGSVDCNGICEVGEMMSVDCNSRCQSGEMADSPDCDGICDFDETISSIDCNNICEPGERSPNDVGRRGGTDIPSPDCDGICDVEDGMLRGGSPDCNGLCEPGELPESIDCNGICEQGEISPLNELRFEGASPDCNGICDLAESFGDAPARGCQDKKCIEPEPSPDCDEVCNPEEVEGSNDCNSICEEGEEDSIDCPEERMDTADKGSMLVFGGTGVGFGPTTLRGTPQITQDTFISLLNDAAEAVSVQLYFINADAPLDAVVVGTPPVVVERAHPGWNYVDCEVRLTPDQPTYFSLSTGAPIGCQPISILDNGAAPGRPDPNNPPNRVINAIVVAWAVAGGPGVAPADRGKPIRHNQLSGRATVVNYLTNSAYEFAAHGIRALVGQQGDVIRTCRPAANVDINRCRIPAAAVAGQAIFAPTGNAVLTQAADDAPFGLLCMDGTNFEFAFERLLLDFFAVGSVAFSNVGGVNALDTQVSLHPLTLDLRQDGKGPLTTKAKYDIWNQNEARLSGTERCLTCADQVWLSNFNAPNQFGLSVLQTDKGKARIDGIASREVCDTLATDDIGRQLCTNDAGLVGVCTAAGFTNELCVNNVRERVTCSEDAALVGYAVKKLMFSTGDEALAASTMTGLGDETAFILNDVITPSSEVRVDYEFVQVSEPLTSRERVDQVRNPQ